MSCVWSSPTRLKEVRPEPPKCTRRRTDLASGAEVAFRNGVAIREVAREVVGGVGWSLGVSWAWG